MPRSTISSREFNQDTAGAKRAAEQGPVYITDRGRPAHVLLTYESYVELTGEHTSIVTLLTQTPGIGDIEFEPQRMTFGAKAADLSDCATC